MSPTDVSVGDAVRFLPFGLGAAELSFPTTKRFCSQFAFSTMVDLRLCWAHTDESYKCLPRGAIMGTLVRTAKFTLAVAAIAAAGAALQHPTVSVLGQPGNGGGGGCSTNCGVGHFGTGGVNSDGKANGTLIRNPSTRFPGETRTEAGNAFAGIVSVTNTGAFSGNFAPDGSLRGHISGEFGECSGKC